MKRLTAKITVLGLTAALLAGSITACAGGVTKPDEPEAEPSEIEEVEPSEESSKEEPATTTTMVRPSSSATTRSR